MRPPRAYFCGASLTFFFGAMAVSPWLLLGHFVLLSYVLRAERPTPPPAPPNSARIEPPGPWPSPPPFQPGRVRV